MSQVRTCPKCGTDHAENRYFCKKCGALLEPGRFSSEAVYEEAELKVMRILENLEHTPHSSILWDDTVDRYLKKVERYRAMSRLPEFKSEHGIADKMEDFVELCTKPEFQIAFVGTIKTGKSTLINALLGHNYASMAVTPETAALTRFRSSPRDYVKVDFYDSAEWAALWASRTSGADAFVKEYQALNADQFKSRWIGHPQIYKELANSQIKSELSVWSSSKRPEHYFVKEIEVGISSLPKSFPSQVVFVDTPGLSDPVAYRSEITRQYIRKANAVFVCVDAQKVQKEEIEMISSVFSFSSHNKSKVFVIATHWDKLNNPEKDWKEQKAWLETRLVGKGFYDTVEMARSNIMPSAAYIYNLCREYETLSYDERIPLMMFALSMRKDPTRGLEACLPEMVELTNIDSIKDVIQERLAGNYQTLLCQDIGRKYLDIVYTLRRIAQEDAKEKQEIISLSNADIRKLNDKLAEQKRNYDQIRANQQRLEALMNTVEKSTQERLAQTLMILRETTIVGNANSLPGKPKSVSPKGRKKRK